ncbi:RNA polymerase II transcription mediator complex subunit Srb7 [Rasamsonia emersonii CBS 393.64]|uniref:Mediator of RNA polymerase II transcription subunit 21 n=1 Tax=Rasamsonia emersonii (strain ATCC 16479 / CBS 393.64 / IMI 116815) TaxID=1408163 RepID=A0A0F4YS68_RASE3|nr:RNA polymerase II transcription mediator complex subunit Srb7 [Rasamsonia emersonii CBS 393.64]KKA20945.1 RNA polymerase II transcription mediator complex subunit Srb7 [Rasamsonia emersonii CBS 393.64]
MSGSVPTMTTRPPPRPHDVPDAMPPLAKIPKNQPSAAPMPAGAVQAQAQAQASSASPPPGHQQQQQQQTEGQATTTTAGTDGGAANQQPDPNQPPRPDSPRTFAYRQRELARDLIIKEQQIEYLIGRLPGIGSSEAEQEARIRELEGELRQVEAERERKAQELRRLGQRLEVVLGAVERGIYARRD